MEAGVTRRQLVAGLGAAGLGLLAGCGRWPWQAQPPVTVHRVGYLITASNESTSAPAPGTNATFDALREGFRERGYLEGQNLVIEYRAVLPDEQRIRHQATELVDTPVSVLVVQASAVPAAKQATDSVPIVFSGGGDPVSLGLVPSLASPGGNVTGISGEVRGSLAGKRLELLKLTAPELSQVAVMRNVMFPGQGQASTLYAAAETLGLGTLALDLRTSGDLASGFEAAAQAGADGLIYVDQPFLAQFRAEVASLALRHGWPSIGNFREFAAAGGLMAYGPSLPSLNRRAAYFVDRILKGAKPADLPVEQPMTFELVVNMKTARELGITFPPEILLQVTEVIE